MFLDLIHELFPGSPAPAPVSGPSHALTASASVRSLLVSFEGKAKLDPSTGKYHPYLCPAGYWTIGVGHVVRANGVMLHGAENEQAANTVYPNGLTDAEVMSLLEDDLAPFETYLRTDLGGASTNQNEFDAMLSLMFNIGPGAFVTSTVLRLHKAGSKKSVLPETTAIDQFAQKQLTPASAADAFLLWDKSGGRILNGLVKRRAAERDLYMRA